METCGPSEPWEAHKHLVFSRETAQWTSDSNSPPWCHEESVYKVWEVLRSGIQGMWNGTSCLFRLQGCSAGSAEQGRDPATPSTTPIENPEHPQEPSLARSSSKH